MENPALGGASECRSGRSDTPEANRNIAEIQAVARIAGAALAALPCDLALDLIGIAQRHLVVRAEIAPDKVAPKPELEAERQRRAWTRFWRTRPPGELRRMRRAGR